MTELIFTLVKAAKKTGGDKYVCETNEEFVIYFPQSYSRNENKQPKDKITILIE